MIYKLVDQSAILVESGKESKVPMIHIAWDEGYIAQTVSNSLGLALYHGQRETRTLCKRCVPVTNVSNIAPTCQDCMQVSTKPDLAKQMEGFGKYFYYKPALLQLFPRDFQEAVKPFIAAVELEKSGAA